MERVLAVPYRDLHACCVAKVERECRTRDEVDMVVRWMNGYG